MRTASLVVAPQRPLPARVLGGFAAFLLILLCLLGGCGPGAIAPVPFSPDQIRAATRDGRTYVFLLRNPGKPDLRLEFRFTDPRANDVKLTRVTYTMDGQPAGKPSANRIPWAGLVKHAHYPADATTIEPERVTVPAGTFAAKKYTVVQGHKVTTAWFAAKLPGAPVKHISTVNGKVASDLQLLAHYPRGVTQP